MSITSGRLAHHRLEELIGREAELTLRRNTGEERVVHGECHRVELTGVAAGVPSYRVTIRPRLSRLELVTQSRIFQGKSVPQIVDAVLTKARVAHLEACRTRPAATGFARV